MVKPINEQILDVLIDIRDDLRTIASSMETNKNNVQKRKTNLFEDVRSIRREAADIYQKAKSRGENPDHQQIMQDVLRRYHEANHDNT